MIAGCRQWAVLVAVGAQDVGEHGWYDKRWMYEESLVMPFIVRWPGVIEAGSINNDIVSNLDFAETFLEIAGADIPGDMQGRSLVPLFKGETPADWRKAFYYHYYEYPGAHQVQKHEGVRTDRYKLISYYDIGEWELFDFQTDPQEVDNLYDNPTYAMIQQDLEEALEKLKQQYNVPARTETVSSAHD